MIVGLALGETKRGPMIMVVAFVGFVGGWLREVIGPDTLFLGGVIPSLGLFFIGHVAWGTAGPDFKALALVALALWALLRWQWGVITVIAAFGFAGLALRLGDAA
jgi:chromate transporter